MAGILCPLALLGPQELRPDSSVVHTTSMHTIFWHVLDELSPCKIAQRTRRADHQAAAGHGHDSRRAGRFHTSRGAVVAASERAQLVPARANAR